MVVYVLYIQADLENVASLALDPSADICLSVRNPTDHLQVREKVVIDRSDIEYHHEHHHHGKHQHPDHEEAPCHFAMKWNHDDPTRCTIRVLPPPPVTGTSTALISSEPTSSSKSSKKKKSHQHSSSASSAASAVETREMTAADSVAGTFVPMLALECQGNIEPFAFHPMGNEFIVTNKSGHVFGGGVTKNKSAADDEDKDKVVVVDLSNGQDWNVVDLGFGSTGVSNLKAKFE